MKFAALAQRIFYPRVDSFAAAERAMQNGGVAGWIMVAVHFVLGAFVIMLIIPEQNVISGDALWPAMIQLFIAFFYGALATYAWRRSRAAIVTMLILLTLDTLIVITRVRGFDPQAAIHILAIILAIGGMRGSFALAASRRAGES
jgi:hypothetical protein